MRQLTQKLKKGKIEIRDVPLPALAAGCILVRNHYSLISAGTEGSTVATARLSLIGKAKARPQQAKQVIEVLRSQGPLQTYRTVTKKLDAYSPLGYSCAGEVIGLGEGVREFHIGDRVACAGNTASHAEIVAIPVNLAVKLAPDADLKFAAFNALGAIAMQGVRRAEMAIGETCVVIGLGLIGQLTGMLLRASGVRVIGIDVDPAAVKSAKKQACDHAWGRKTPGLSKKIDQLTGGIGVDAVIIAAGTSSLDPINFAGELCRKRGKVIILGAVPTGFDRDPHYYRKELDLRMSCSYGPGRYDLNYEEKGIDYPSAYVRWTEKRNMESFQRLIENEQLAMGGLVTHVFGFEKAADAYEMILSKSEPFLGMLLEYDIDEAAQAKPRIEVNSTQSDEKNGLSFIGAGSYAQSFLLPNLAKEKGFSKRGVATNSGTTSRRVADQYGFNFCTDKPEEILADEQTSTVFIATRHDTHADFVLKGIRADKHVYVEKPLCLTSDELVEIEKAYKKTKGKRQLMVGFNRRFAPLATKIKSVLSDSPMSVVYRINAGAIPMDSWIQDMEVGGGRIIGEACHFIDLITYFTGSKPVQIYASALGNAGEAEDNVTITLEFENGSVGTVHYLANGAKSLSKEYIEVFQNECSYVIDDFRSSTWHTGGGKPTTHKGMAQNKGQAEMVSQFMSRVRSGGEPLIPFGEIYAVTAATLAAVASLRNHMPVKIK